MKKDLYVVTKFIFANSAEEAIRKDKTSKVNEIWIENDWKKNKVESLINNKKHKNEPHMGFQQKL